MHAQLAQVAEDLGRERHVVHGQGLGDLELEHAWRQAALRQRPLDDLGQVLLTELPRGEVDRHTAWLEPLGDPDRHLAAGRGERFAERRLGLHAASLDLEPAAPQLAEQQLRVVGRVFDEQDGDAHPALPQDSAAGGISLSTSQ